MANISITHAKSLTQAEWTGTVTVYNSSGGSVSALATDLAGPSEWNSGHNITFGLSASDIPAAEFFEPSPLISGTVSTRPPNNSWFATPIYLPFGFNSGHMMMLGSQPAVWEGPQVFSAASTGSVSKTYELRQMFALYSYSGGNKWASAWSTEVSYLATQTLTVSSTATNDVRITNAATLSMPSQFDASGGMTYGTSSQSGSLAVAASTAVSGAVTDRISGLMAYYTASRQFWCPVASLIPAGDYIFAHAQSTTMGTTGTRYTSVTGWTAPAFIYISQGGVMGGAYALPWVSATTSLANDVPRGLLNTTTASASSAFAASDFSYSTHIPYVQFNNLSI